MNGEDGRKWRASFVRVAVIAGVLCAIGGIGWVATGATTSSVISACVEPASSQLFYSSSGTCPGGQTLVTWDQQGQQGPQGQPGQQGPPGASAASAATTAFGPSKYVNGFTISAEVDTKGNYDFAGTIQNELVTTVRPGRNFSVYCAVLSGPPNGSATRLTDNTTTYFYNRHTRTYQPNGFNGPDGLDAVQVVGPNDVPLEVYYTCKKLGISGRVVFTHPALTLTAARALHLKVGPALPVHQVVGPGPLRVLGGGG
jgi:hypothetical protein